MSNITRCGYCCDLCKAYAPNIKINDQRKELSETWKKYYDLDIPAKDIYCDGCRCERSDAKRIDNDCPVRKCTIDEKLGHCGECSKYPCTNFEQRRGLTAKEAEDKLKGDFKLSEYNKYLLAYDNKTRIDEYKKNNK